jgi:hypothetical protein
MKSWAEYMKFKEELDDLENPSGRFKINNADNFGVDYEHTMGDLLKILITKYHGEFLQFLRKFVEKGDGELGNLLKKIDKEPNSITYQRFGDDDIEEIVPNGADKGYSDGGEDE